MSNKKNPDDLTKTQTNGSSEYDGLPTDAELDALQAAIDMEKAGVEEREPADVVPENVPENAPENEPDTLLTSERQIKQLQAELDALKDQALRAMADAENVKKRAEREVVAAKTYGIERFAVDMLSVCDNISRALLTLEGQARDDLGDNAKNLLEGIELTEKDMMATLSRHGVKPVPGQGTKFDPNVHQAVAQIPSQEDKGYVAQVMQTGFTLGERTLRAAMVAVSTGPAKD